MSKKSKSVSLVVLCLLSLNTGWAAEKSKTTPKSEGTSLKEAAPPTTSVVKVPATSQTESTGSAGEDWKGKPDPRGFDAGVLFGLGIIDTSSAFAVMGTISRRILEDGFIPDVADAVKLEGQAGVVMTDPKTAFAYSAHLRWDFFKDQATIYYALAGFGGNVVDVGTGTRFALHPRLGIGGMWTVASPIKIRAEFSHELVGVGMVFAF